MTLEDVIVEIKKYHPNVDVTLLKKAYNFASRAHDGQKRKSGEEYIIHPLAVAFILAQLQLDIVAIEAAFLHDVVEDTLVSLKEIEEIFGSEVAMLVDGVTKLSKIEYKSKEEEHVENLRKMFIAMAKDIRVILIKLADRLHNMRTLKYQSTHKQKEIAEETIEIFAPIAHRLGIFRIKWELEDLALRYLAPEAYYELVESIQMKRQEREQYINLVIVTLQQKLQQMGIRANIDGRPKHFYSIYNKMKKQSKEINQLYDLIAIRVIVDNVKDCYGALGIVHTLWKPIPGRFKDYIAMPKPNMYQSLHTTVIGEKGDPFEIQIRTWDMHRIAEYGIAAHWRYKEGNNQDSNFDKKLSWLRQLLEWQRELGDAKEFVDTLKKDLFSDRVYVFTPKGDIVELSAGSTPLDFAYKVHTVVGHNCIGAKVNDRIVTLDYQLKTGDIIEILTSKNSRPSRDWINIVKTVQAKNKIKQWFKKEKREENIIKGKDILEKEAKKQNVNYEYLKQNYLSEVIKKLNFSSIDDLYAVLGDGYGISPLQVIAKIKDLFIEDKKTNDFDFETNRTWKIYGKPSKGIKVKGIENVVVRLSRCCNPLPGDDIVGYITRGRGVSIHRKDCPNAINLMKNESERIIETAWDKEFKAVYQVQLEVVAIDRLNLTMDVITAVAETRISINAVNSRISKNNLAIIDLKLQIENLDQLHNIMIKIKKIKDIIEVKRITPKSH